MPECECCRADLDQVTDQDGSTGGRTVEHYRCPGCGTGGSRVVDEDGETVREVGPAFGSTYRRATVERHDDGGLLIADGGDPTAIMDPVYEDHEVTGVYGDPDETFPIADHVCLMVNVRAPDGYSVKAGCVECGHVSNHVTGFIQRECPETDLNNPIALTDGGSVASASSTDVDDGSTCWWCGTAGVDGAARYHPTCDRSGCDNKTHGYGPDGTRHKAYCPDCREGSA